MSRTPQPAAEPALSPDDLARFCEYLGRRTGMIFGESKRYYIDRRVADRMAKTGEADFAGYFARLRSHPAELQAVTNAFAINETYFYREAHQLACLSRSLLPEIVADKGPGDRVRIWSAPCSTGEEPYSIAIWLLEHWPMVDAYNVEIVGSDIDTEALSDARRRDYGPHALARVPPDDPDRYLETATDDRRSIIPDFRDS
ncbi:MAG: protein-glutamate O-methyltransferase CheR, partial [Proteobacteria bacterium]|nr:protein-glutamate O-methyltransferase CheR [Pseudomonadota bacterium]